MPVPLNLTQSNICVSLCWIGAGVGCLFFAHTHACIASHAYCTHTFVCAQLPTSFMHTLIHTFVHNTTPCIPYRYGIHAHRTNERLLAWTHMIGCLPDKLQCGVRFVRKCWRGRNDVGQQRQQIVSSQVHQFVAILFQRLASLVLNAFHEVQNQLQLGSGPFFVHETVQPGLDWIGLDWIGSG